MTNMVRLSCPVVYDSMDSLKNQSCQARDAPTLEFHSAIYETHFTSPVSESLDMALVNL